MKQGWEIKKLGEVCTFQRGLTYSKDDEVEHSNNCVLRSNNIDLDSMSIVFDELKYINDDFVVSEDKKVKPNTILICMSNGSKQHIGKVAFIDKEYGYAFGGFMGLIKPNTEVSPKFIYYSCISSSYKHFLAGIGNGANITNLKFSDLQQYTLPVPPREEQESVVAELDCLSGIIEKKREQLRELDALAQSIFYQMFGDPNTNDRNWDVVKLNTTCDNLDYQRRPITAKDRIEGDIPYYGASGVVDYVQDYIFDRDYLLVSEDGANLEVRHTPIAFSIKGKTWVNNHAHILKFEHYCTQLFMEYYINLLDISDIITGCAQPKLTQANLNSIEVFDISIEKQQEFADKIEAIEKQKELIKKSISETETLFNARMNDYFN